MKKVSVLSLALALLLTASGNYVSNTVRAQAKGETLNTPTNVNRATQSANTIAIFPLEQIKPGMRATARTVFAGSEPEEFGVEILGVMPGYPAPKQSAIIARLTGANVEKTSVFGGMSGSPVFIDGKLVGAIAFTFPFAKEPIAGITPIQQMIDIFERGTTIERPLATQPRRVSTASLMRGEWNFNLPKPVASNQTFIQPVSANASQYSSLAALLGQQVAQIQTPVIFSGISPDALAKYATQLQANNLLPVSGVGGAAGITPLTVATEKTLLPGSSISVQLVRGDYSVAASGTVTMRDGDRIYAFGHPFMGLGAADMPMTESSVVSVVASQYNSFKLSVPGNLVGAISQDRSTGIYGRLGAQPRMIPVELNLRTSRDRTETFKYEIASDQNLAPLLLNLTVYSALTASERAMGDSTVSMRGEIDVAGQDTIRIERRYSSADALTNVAGMVTAPVAALLASGFDNVNIRRIKLDVTSEDVRQIGTLERIAVNRTDLKAGETVEVQAFVRAENGAQFVERVPVKIPQDAPAGQLLLFVGDGDALQQLTGDATFIPTNLTQLVSVINRLRKTDRLYVKLLRVTPGAVVGSQQMPALPPSVVATLNSERSAGGVTGTQLASLYERELSPVSVVVSGQQLLTLNITR